ncbi:hypothetical protein GCM10017691_18440 [Pseudonocardia petroleophila]|uniref:Sigma-70 region 2 n=1 Tax=Pseudonocardia petroleophila TaxID=37331 RepID=A0A7G7MH46_9PSEU|nr:sigma factor [Pseudonocardia petroleophila]QNG52107.1 hypothetical protein H6H00_29345 [Pseudonocardia petroleophila]
MNPHPDAPRPARVPGRRPPPAPEGVDPRSGDTDELLVAAGRGDRDAFAAFYDRTSPAVFGLLRSVLPRSAEAERAAEAVYLQVWRTAADFDPLGGSAWSAVLSGARRFLTGPVHDRIRAARVQVTPGDLMDRPDRAPTGPDRPPPDPRGDPR